MKRISLLLAVTACLGLANRCNAQFGSAASTPESAAGHAIADMIRSEGVYNQMSTAAMINFEQARGKYIENQRQWTDVYLLKRRALDAEHARSVESARARNAKYLDDQAAHPSHLPPRLFSGQLDSSTGKIAWPSALRRDVFAAPRQEMEALLASRARTGSTSELSEAIYRQTRYLHEELRQYIREIVFQEYMDARKFLDSLALEGLYPVDSQASLR
jgi:hypothetical protein